MDKVSKFIDITEQMNITYELKNNDYGDSFGESVEKYGLISALTRISDKFNRLESLILNQHQQVKDESLKDTLLDLACYSIMTIIELESDSVVPASEENEILKEEIKELKNYLQEEKYISELQVEELEKEIKNKNIEIESLKNKLQRTRRKGKRN